MAMSRDKSERLRQWGEEQRSDNILDDLDGFNDNMVTEFKTLRVSRNPDVVATSSPVKHKGPRATISPSVHLKPEANEDIFAEFEDGFDQGGINREKFRLNTIRLTPTQNDGRFLPHSSASPLRRRSLSNYSESTDTDITEMNEEDFEDIDDIFGKEESGIYSSGGRRQHAANVSRASQILTEKKLQLRRQAELEDEELFAKYQNRHGDEVHTLRLKDLTRYQQNAKEDENEPTLNYEYTRDDNESFEEGFDANIPLRLEATKLKQFQSQPNIARLTLKASMPVFPNSLNTAPTKFRSTMDLAGQLNDEHPFFNNSNKLIRKLDRMPSFQQPKTVRKMSTEDQLNYDMERKKNQLLEKYMEITEKQKQLNTSPRKPRKKQLARHSKKGVGLVKYLNDRTGAPAIDGNDKMRYNAAVKRWEGNDHDLLRFEEQVDTIRAKKPSLITRKDFSSHPEKISGNMKYDAENMRWINLNKVEEEDFNVFDELSDLEHDDIPQYQSAKPPGERGVSTFTQRTVLTVSSDQSSGRSSAGEEFQLSSRLASRFEREEQKIKKKTHHWFGPHEQYHLEKKTFDSEYFWEIRKMVMDNSGQ